MYNILGKIQALVEEKVLERMEEFDVEEFVEDRICDDCIDCIISEVVEDMVDVEDMARDVIKENL